MLNLLNWAYNAYGSRVLAVWVGHPVELLLNPEKLARQRFQGFCQQKGLFFLTPPGGKSEQNFAHFFSNAQLAHLLSMFYFFVELTLIHCCVWI